MADQRGDVDATLVEITDGATGPRSPGAVAKVSGAKARHEPMGGRQECAHMSSAVSACRSNPTGERSEVSRGHSSQTPAVMGRTG